MPKRDIPPRKTLFGVLLLLLPHKFYPISPVVSPRSSRLVKGTRVKPGSAWISTNHLKKIQIFVCLCSVWIQSWRPLRFCKERRIFSCGSPCLTTPKVLNLLIDFFFLIFCELYVYPTYHLHLGSNLVLLMFLNPWFLFWGNAFLIRLNVKWARFWLRWAE